MTTFQNRLLFRRCAVGSERLEVPQAMEEYCFSRVTLRIALNPAMWERIREICRLDDIPVVFVPNGAEEEFFTQHQAPCSPVEGRFNICYTGVSTKNRGIDILVNSCSILRERCPWIRLYLIGPYGPGIPDGLKEVIETSDVIVRTVLPRNEIPAVLVPMDLLVLQPAGTAPEPGISLEAL